MRKKITTHPRFISKLERDLKRVFHQEDYESFVELYHELIALQHPNEQFIEMYYASLFNLEKYEEALMYSEVMFRMSEDPTENRIHMLMMLTVLEKLGKYDELFEWIKVIKTNPFIDEMESSYLDAIFEIEKQALENVKNDEVPKRIMTQDIETALKSKSLDTKLQAIETLIDNEDPSYATLVNQLYKKESFRVIESMMVAYLKSVDFQDEPIKLFKFGEHFEKYTSEFKDFETSSKLDKTIEWIVEIGSMKFAGNKSRIEETIEIFINISMLWYPYHVPFPPKALANGFINYVRVLHDELEPENFHGRLAEWIVKIEEEMMGLRE